MVAELSTKEKNKDLFKVSEPEVQRSSVSESVPEAYYLLKPYAGGVAFWRSLMSIIKECYRECYEFDVIALKLHSKAWLYLVPVSVVAGKYYGYNLSIAKVSKIEIIDWKTRRIRVRCVPIPEVLGFYLEVCPEGEECFRVYRNYRDRLAVEKRSRS